MNAISPAELEQLIRDHSSALVLYARQWCDSPDDVVQESFFALFRQSERPVNIVPWLYRTVRNRGLNARRAMWRRSKYEKLAYFTGATRTESPDRDELDHQQISNCLKALESDLRETLVARIWGGLSFDEIAEVTDTSVSTAFRRYRRALEALRKGLAESPEHHIDGQGLQTVLSNRDTIK